jgi:cysteine dioxygenase
MDANLFAPPPPCRSYLFYCAGLAEKHIHHFFRPQDISSDYNQCMTPVAASTQSRTPSPASTDHASAADRFPKLGSLLRYLDSLSARADLAVLRTLLGELRIARADLTAACHFCEEHYQRNTIKESPWYELVCLCWRSGQRTPIHDHRGSSCAFRVIDGTAMESRFELTASGLLRSTGSQDLTPGFICASHDADIHQVLNAQPAGRDVITLHIYSPPLRSFRKYTLDSPTTADQMTEHICSARPV